MSIETCNKCGKPATSTEKYCDTCNIKMIPFGNSGWWTCPVCGYGHMYYPEDLPKRVQLTEEEMRKSKQLWGTSFFIKNDNTTFVIGNIEDLKNTIQIDRCKRIVFRDKTLDFVFELPDLYYKDIDTIIINGHKFIRENNNVE